MCLPDFGIVLAACSAGTSVPPKLVNQVLDAIGLDWDNQVSFNKLMEIVDLLPAVSSFMKYDTDSSGFITRAEVKAVVRDMEAMQSAHQSGVWNTTNKLVVSA
jgi:hypothetical protein